MGMLDKSCSGVHSETSAIWPKSPIFFRKLIQSIAQGQPFRDVAFVPLLIFVYALSFGWIFLVQAKFWDDLSLPNNPDLLHFFFQAGLPLSGYLCRAIMAVNFKNIPLEILIFVSFLTTFIVLRRFLATLGFFSELERNAIVLLTAALPLFQSRFLLATAYYVVSLPLFVGGCALLISSLQKDRWSYRLPAYCLLTLSFFIQSFLVLYFFVLLVAAIAVSQTSRSPAGIGSSIELGEKNADMILFPFLFFFLKPLIFPTTGPFKDYNSFSFIDIKQALFQLPISTFEALRSVLQAGPTAGMIALCFVLLAFYLFLILRRQKSPKEDSKLQEIPRSRLGALLIATAGLMFSVLPYEIVHRSPGPYDFADRHQLTLVLTVGPFLVVATRFLTRYNMRWIALVLVLVWSVADNVQTYAAIIVDGHTQDAVVEEFSHNRELRENATFLVDSTRWPNLSRNRQFGSAQLNCLLKEAFGDEKRFAVALQAQRVDFAKELSWIDRYKNTGTCYREYQAGGRPILVKITPGSRRLHWSDGMKLSVESVLAPQRYHEQLRDLVAISTEPAPDQLFVVR